MLKYKRTPSKRLADVNELRTQEIMPSHLISPDS